MSTTQAIAANAIDFIRESGIDSLTAELGIEVTRHETLPLAILNYSQIDSPKLHPIVRQCRGLVIDTERLRIVGRPFERFFNWGEVQDEMGSFDFSDFTTQEKLDGSLCLVWFYGGEWHFSTRGSFGFGELCFDMTWRDTFCRASGQPDLEHIGDHLEPGVTYVCELCSPWNKVVREYREPSVYLLTAVRRDGLELSGHECAIATENIGWKRPEYLSFRSIDEIIAYLERQAVDDPTFEGVVIRDSGNRRWKVKSASYLRLHKMKNNGCLTIRDLVPMILEGETDELLSYFGEFRTQIDELRESMDRELADAEIVWNHARHDGTQKDFALSIVGKTPFTSVLFEARKKSESVRAVWNRSADLIAKVLST